MKIYKTLLLVTFISLFFTTLSLAIPKKISNTKNVTNIGFGVPITFIKQDLSSIDRNYPFMAYIESPWENPTKIIWSSFLLNLIIYDLVGIILIFVVQKNKIGRVS